MRSFKSSGLLALAAVTALVGSSLPSIGLMPGQAPLMSPAPAAVSAPLPVGTMTLTTQQKKGVVEWEDLRQEFTSGDKNCQLKPTPGTANLLTLRGYLGTMSSSAGFKNGSIGVYEFTKPNGPPANASHCDLVDTKKDNGKNKKMPPKETLGIHLGPDAADSFGPLVMTRAALSLYTHTKTGEILVTLLDAEGATISTTTVKWSSATGGPNPLPRVFTGEFSGIKLTAQKGDFSLRGGTFDLATLADDVFCTDGSDNTFTNDAGVTVTFIGNADGSPCTAFGIRLTGTDDAQVWFIKPLDVDPEAQFIFEIPWDTVGWPALEPGSALPQAFIDFEEATPPIEREMSYCPDYLFDESGTLVGLDGSSQADRDALALLDMVPDVAGDLRTDGTQFACIADRDGSVSKSSGPGYDVGLTDVIYLIGDAKMSLK